MSFSSSSESVSGLSIKKFVTQDEVDEKRKKRQEEWEKVRKPEDPVDCPEEPVDNRSLYDKLEEQRIKKQEEYDEQFAFRNQVKRLDDDEVEFLDFVSERQQDLSREKRREEAEIISEMKDAQVVKIADTKAEEKRVKQVQQTNTKRSQSALLAGAVRRKGSEDTSPNKKPRLSSAETSTSQEIHSRKDGPSTSDKQVPKSDGENRDNVEDETATGSTSEANTVKNLARVVAVRPSVLPGITQYEDSTDSESSSSDSEPDFALGGRNYVCVNKIQQSR